MSDADPAETFDLLGDQTRVAVVRALLAHRSENPRKPALSFSELRERVGERDSGKFNYHLGKLTGRLVEKTDDGYRLTAAGARLGVAVLAGLPGDADDRAPVPLDADCPVCDAPLEIWYEDGSLEVACETHTTVSIPLPPAALAHHDLPDALDVAVLDAQHAVRLATRGTCAECYGHVDTRLLDPREEPGLDDPSTYLFHAVCADCGNTMTTDLSFAVVDHPEVVAFLHDHGIDRPEDVVWELSFIEGQDHVTEVDTDPLRVRVTLDLDGDEFSVLFDEHAEPLRMD